MGGQRVAHHRTLAGDQVEHPGRQPHLFTDLGEQEARQRRLFTGLEHRGAAGGQCGAHLGNHLEQREIPGCDEGADADGIAHHQIAFLLALFFHGVREIAEDRQALDGAIHLDTLGEMHRNAHFLGNETGELIGALGQPGADRIDITLAFRGGSPRPGGKRAARGRHGCIDILRMRCRHPRKGFFRGGIDQRAEFTAARGYPLTVDKDVVVLEHLAIPLQEFCAGDDFIAGPLCNRRQSARLRFRQARVSAASRQRSWRRRHRPRAHCRP